MQKLPIGVHAFETIRKRGYVYVDKTRYIHHIADEGMFYFLTRPRGFGKSLLVSTLKCFFQGKRELFEGLWLGENGKQEWNAFPVILIDFNDIPCNSPESLKQGISLNLKQIARDYGISLKTAFIETLLHELVSELSKKTGTEVVVLVDEYDRPVTEHIGRGDKRLETAMANYDIIRNFLGVLKGGRISPLLRFVLITGILRFRNISAFSAFDMNDITMDTWYADMLGYTQEELEHYFREHIEQLSQVTQQPREDVEGRLTRQYHGYRFSEKDIKVYNPFSVLMSLSHKTFGNHWSAVVPPLFFADILREYDLLKLEDLKVDEQIFSLYEIDDIKSESLLFHAGYMTIKRMDDTLYTLGYPNQEAKTALLRLMARAVIPGNDWEDRSKFLWLAKHLESGDFNAFFETMTDVFNAVPNIPGEDDEVYFYRLFYLMVSASGMNAQSELLTREGLIDIVLTFPEQIFVMEFRCDQDADVAIMQIREKGYADQYKQSGKKLFLVGIGFSLEKRNLSDWKVERLFLFH